MEKTKEVANQAKDSIGKFVDTIKLKAHLASMDSKDAWEKFEAQFEIIKRDIHKFSDGLKGDSDEARLQAHLALMDAKERWDIVKDNLEHWLDSVGDSAEQTFDHARVKASLAKLEVKDNHKVDEYKKRFHKVGAEIKDDWYSFLSRLDGSIVEFINKFPLK